MRQKIRSIVCKYFSYEKLYKNRCTENSKRNIEGGTMKFYKIDPFSNSTLNSLNAELRILKVVAIVYENENQNHFLYYSLRIEKL